MEVSEPWCRYPEDNSTERVLLFHPYMVSKDQTQMGLSGLFSKYTLSTPGSYYEFFLMDNI